MSEEEDAAAAKEPDVRDGVAARDFLRLLDRWPNSLALLLGEGTIKFLLARRAGDDACSCMRLSSSNDLWRRARGRERGLVVVVVVTSSAVISCGSRGVASLETARRKGRRFGDAVADLVVAVV